MRKKRHLEIAYTAKQIGENGKQLVELLQHQRKDWFQIDMKVETWKRQKKWSVSIRNDREMKILIKLETLEKRDKSHNLNEEGYRHRMEVVLLKARIRRT